MKKAKVFLMVTAALIAVSVALASRPHWNCTQLTNYYWNGENYVAVGVMGEDYFCSSSGNVCTYYLNGNTYTPCQAGTYTPLSVNDSKAATSSAVKHH